MCWKLPLRRVIFLRSNFVFDVSVLAALNITTHILRPGGTFVAKVFRGKDIDLLSKQLDLFFEKSCIAKPRSSRTSSLEAFAVCRGFKMPHNCHPNFFNPFLNPESSLDFTSLTAEERLLIPYVSCGDLTGFDSDCSHPLELTTSPGEAVSSRKPYEYKEPVQPPIKPPYQHAVSLKRANKLDSPLVEGSKWTGEVKTNPHLCLCVAFQLWVLITMEELVLITMEELRMARHCGGGWYTVDVLLQENYEQVIEWTIVAYQMDSSAQKSDFWGPYFFIDLIRAIWQIKTITFAIRKLWADMKTKINRKYAVMPKDPENIHRNVRLLQEYLLSRDVRCIEIGSSFKENFALLLKVQKVALKDAMHWFSQTLVQLHPYRNFDFPAISRTESKYLSVTWNSGLVSFYPHN